ncbi:DUF4433 domain-containing protein [candidate division KSB1 bacterium]|nr:DUF4433 domain-containing protein [candidate division KSB1 bacterium]
MDISDIKELYFIAPIDSIPSILQHGILSHNRAQMILHRDISMPEVQKRRANKRVLGARPLHDYANLYFDAHNPMLSKRRDQNEFLCILGISKSVLFMANVVLTDRNAASDYARFFSSPLGLQYLDVEIIFAKYWNHSDQFQYMEHKSKKCSEVLVPDFISDKVIEKAYVWNDRAKNKLIQAGFKLAIEIKPELFF